MKYLLSLKKLSVLCMCLSLSISIAAKDGDALFLENQVDLNADELITLDSSMAMLTKDMTTGFVDSKAFQGLAIGESVYMELPGIAPGVNFVMTRVDHNIEGVVTYLGHVDGFGGSSFVLSLEGDKLVGNIDFNGYSYRLEPISNVSNAHVIYQMDFSGFQSSDNLSVELSDNTITLPLSADISISSLSTGAKPGPGTEPQGCNQMDGFDNGPGAKIRVLFLQANNVAISNADASNMISNFNCIVDMSQVNTDVELSMAGSAVQQINADFAGQSRRDILGLMNSRTGVFSDIDIRMRAVQADIVLLYIATDLTLPDPRFGGAANLSAIPFNNPAEGASSPFALTTDTFALGDLTAVHELGHLLSGSHAEPLADGEEQSSFMAANGVDGANGQWQTIMGGYNGDRCGFRLDLPAGMQACRRIRYFSNPNIPSDTVQAPTGVNIDGPIGFAGDADMAAVLPTTMNQAVNWGSNEPVIYAEPVRGFVFDPMKNGHGVHISEAPTGDYVLYFYTFDEAGRPEWFLTDVLSYSNNLLQGQLLRANFSVNPPLNNVTTTVAGTFSMDYSIPAVNAMSNCDGVNRSLQPGVFTWVIDENGNGNIEQNETGAWCMVSVLAATAGGGVPNNIPNVPSNNSGTWFEPQFNGWGFNLETITPTGQSNIGTAFTVVYFYDTNDIGRWATAFTRPFNNLDNINFGNNVRQFMGYPRSGNPPNGLLPSQIIGALNLQFGQPSMGQADIDIDLVSPLNGPWQRIDAEMLRLTE